MPFDTVWYEITDRCERLDPDEVLVTPASERAFEVVSARPDRVVVRYVDDERERPLQHDQFEVLYDRLEDDEDLSLDDLPPGVEPYVSVLSLLPRYVADESAGVLRRATDDETFEDGESEESPFVRPAWVGRTPPERVHDDAVLLADVLDRFDVSDPESIPVERLIDVYVLLSDVGRGADRLRREVGDDLLGFVGPDDRLHGQFGTVTRTERERRHLRDEETVLDALDREGIPHEWILGIDREKLDVVLATTDLAASDVYDTEETVYLQKTGVDESEKQSRLQGLVDRLEALDTEEGSELREEIDGIEERLDALLASG